MTLADRHSVALANWSRQTMTVHVRPLIYGSDLVPVCVKDPLMLLIDILFQFSMVILPVFSTDAVIHSNNPVSLQHSKFSTALNPPFFYCDLLSVSYTDHPRFQKWSCFTFPQWSPPSFPHWCSPCFPQWFSYFSIPILPVLNSNKQDVHEHCI